MCVGTLYMNYSLRFTFYVRVCMCKGHKLSFYLAPWTIYLTRLQCYTTLGSPVVSVLYIGQVEVGILFIMYQIMYIPTTDGLCAIPPGITRQQAIAVT